MRDLKDFTAGEWLRGEPLVHTFKQWRNDLVQDLYLRQRADGLDEFLKRLAAAPRRAHAYLIAFEQPWVLDWVLRMAAANLTDAVPIVIDNSRGADKRAEIAQVCASRNVPYLALPQNRTRHVNRSHGMALSWTWHNVVRAAQPEVFGLFDHDLMPLEPVSLMADLGDQPFYGFLKERRWGWHLWAGFSVFRYDVVRDRPLNFLYDFSRDLDTGGRNWAPLYREFDPRRYRFCSQRMAAITVPGLPPREMEVLDERWLHLQGVGYNDNFATRADFFAQLERATREGISLRQLLAPAPIPSRPAA